MAAEHGHSPLSHVVDQRTLELPFWRHPYGWEIHLPVIHLPWLGGRVLEIPITRFMVTELIAAILMLIILPIVARHMTREHVARGWFHNMFEAMFLFIRDQVARPAIGGHGADAFLPFLWTIFFFILFNNLLGLIPGMASATGNINVTGVLALMTLGTVILAGMREMGALGFWVGIVPHLDVPWWLKPPLWGLMFVIEVAGLLIRHVVLAVRLFANMFAGHVVLAVILGFILMARGFLFYPVMAASVGGVILLSLLELFVAFLQAYIFTFLSALFIGSAVHPH
jgi:F-type H+-transporting ATPase subunit a